MGPATGQRGRKACLFFAATELGTRGTIERSSGDWKLNRHNRQEKNQRFGFSFRNPWNYRNPTREELITSDNDSKM